MMKKKEKFILIIFILVTLIAGFLGVLVDQILTEQPEGSSLGMLVWLVLPLITGLIGRGVLKEWKSFGIKLKFRENIRWLCISLFAFPIITLICIFIALCFRGIYFEKVVVATLPGLFLGAAIGSGIKNIFEEFSWRGNLVPFLEKTGMNDFVLYLVSGFIWGGWHVAYYLFFLEDSYFVDITRPQMVITGIVIMILWSPLFVELYRLTHSVWPCVILHTMIDVIPTLLFTTAQMIHLDKHLDFMLNPTSGVIPILLTLGLGLWLRKKRCEKIYSSRPKEKSCF